MIVIIRRQTDTAWVDARALRGARHAAYARVYNAITHECWKDLLGLEVFGRLALVVDHTGRVGVCGVCVGIVRTTRACQTSWVREV